MKIGKVKPAPAGEKMDFIFCISVPISSKDRSVLPEVLLPMVKAHWINGPSKASTDEADSIIRVNYQSPLEKGIMGFNKHLPGRILRHPASKQRRTKHHLGAIIS